MKNTARTRSYPVVQMLRKTLYLAIPVIILFMVVSYFTFSEIRKQNKLSLENTVNIYQTELAQKLSAISHFVQWTVVHDPILDSFAPDKHMGDFREASNELRLRVSDMQYSTGSEYQFFFYWDEKDIFFNASEINIDYDTYKEIKKRITTDSESYSWVPCEINGKTFLYYSINYYHRTFVCLVDMEDVLSPIARLDLGEYGAISAYRESDDVFYKIGDGPDGLASNYYTRLVFPESKDLLPFSIAIDTTVLGNYGRLYLLQFIVFLAVLLLCFIMGGYILVSYKKVILPIKIFSKSLSEMDSVSEDSELVITDSKVQELNQINDQFKNLIHEITRLRIDIYEAELDKNKFMIHFLQQQIKPHFYLNCLTTIDSMVSLGDIDAAKKMLMFTSRYFRYLFQVDMNFVPLMNELSHAQDYLSIQNMRLSQATEYTTEIPKKCKDLEIPPLLLLTFIENSIKHATPPEGEPLKISVICRIINEDLEKRSGTLEIEICDNGQGFPSDMKLTSSSTEHIGIANSIKRLNLLYGDEFELFTGNISPHGAKVTLRLPIGAHK